MCGTVGYTGNFQNAYNYDTVPQKTEKKISIPYCIPQNTIPIDP